MIERRGIAAFGALLCAAALAGCGNERGQPPELTGTLSPNGFEEFVSDDGDVEMPVPKNWGSTPRPQPGVVTIASGGAALTVWAYPAVTLVSDEEAAEAARQRLIDDLEEREPRFEVTGSRVIGVDGAPAIEIRGEGRVGDRPVIVRVVHVYKGAGEYVIDAYADPEDFERADREVFFRVLDGIALGGNPASVVAAAEEAAEAEESGETTEEGGETTEEGGETTEETTTTEGG